jgi:GH43 family beta-xylosidase
MRFPLHAMSRLLFASLTPLIAATACKAAHATFTNPIAEGADPWVVYHQGQYVWCFSEGNRGISVWLSDRLTSLGERHLVWEAPETGPYSREVWAPEMHLLNGRWYIYFAASDGRNENHLAYALRSDGPDPLGPYSLHGPFATGDGPDGRSPNLWAIDMTVLERKEQRYAIWSGWDAPGTDRQFLYIAPMSDPLTLSGPRVLMAANDDFLWERTEERIQSRGLMEAPQVLQSKGRTFVIYSTGASWLRTYKLGLLELTGADPLDPASWTKHPSPVFQSSGETTGVGHSTFVQSPDGSEWWHVFHAKMDPNPGWRRAVFIQPFTFRDDGFPMFGEPVAAGAILPTPSGQSVPEHALPFRASLRAPESLRAFSYFGHQQFLRPSANGVQLGAPPRQGINEFRTGEKLVLDHAHFGDFELSTKVRVLGGDRDAGLLFRVKHPALGYDAQEGYFAGIIPGAQRVILGKMDGRRWTELARAEASIAADAVHSLGVRAVGDHLEVFLNGRPALAHRDSTYAEGSIGIRVVDTHAQFEDLRVEAPRDALRPAEMRPAEPAKAR